MASDVTPVTSENITHQNLFFHLFILTNEHTRKEVDSSEEQKSGNEKLLKR